MLLVQGVLALGIRIACAQIDGSDPSLRLWLKADTLSGPTVPVWTDSSSYGIILSAPELPPGDTADDLMNHTPQLISVDNNGVIFNAVRFRQANDPITPDPTYGHLADRLWQTNNLDENDPTLIDPGSNLTMIVVYANNAPNAALGPDQTIFAKRGPSSCPYEFGLDVAIQSPAVASLPSHMFVTYAGSTTFSPTPPIPSQPEWAIVEMSVTAEGNMTVREYYASLGGWRTSSMEGVSRGGDTPSSPFTIAFHTQGAGGTEANPWGNGAYERFAGDIAEFALYNRSLSSDELSNIETGLLVKYFLKAGPPTITTQPQSQLLNEFDSATFKVSVDGTPPFSYQWLKDGSPIAGANGSILTLTGVLTKDAGNYSVIVSNSLDSVTSQAAVLTIIADTNPPAVSSALLNYVDNTSVTVLFSELVDPATATNPGNYSFNNSVGVTSVAIGQTNNTYWSNYISSVVLTTTPITSQSTLTVSGVLDRAGNRAENAQAVILVPGALTIQPPSVDRLLWLSADLEVLADDTGVYEWNDKSGAANEHDALYSFGAPQQGLVSFPNGMHPVVSFDGSAGLALDNTADFNVQNLTVYVVGDVDNTKTSMNFLGNWEGWTLGISDGSPGVIKWVTYEGGGVRSVEPAASHLDNRIPALIEGAFTYPGNKSVTVNGVQLSSQASSAAIDYATARGVTVGSLFPTPTQTLVGDIAEILVYSNVSPDQDAAVRAYLAAKYFSPSTVLPRLASAILNATNDTIVTVIFSEAVSAITATDASHYAIDHGVSVSAAMLVDPTTVTLTTSAVTGPTATLTVNGITDWAGNAIAWNSQIAISGISAPPSNSIRAQDTSADHLLVLEAEDYNQNLSPSADGHSWVLTTAPAMLNPGDANTNFSGTGAMEAEPNTDVNNGTNTLGPELDYKVYFQVAGTNYVWVRGVGDSAPGPSQSDSIQIGMDGALTGMYTGFPQGAGYTWSNTAQSFANPIVINAPGMHTINVWMREDGFGFDKLLLTTNPNYTPSGLGPAESTAALPGITLTKSGLNISLSWVMGTLQSATNVIGPYQDVSGASSPYQVTPTGTQQFYRTRQ
ncbi:MAG: immunoglobulin domain-containing protein [Candidatus Omnitrophica bacterium]|nr:immunoglobulin domain-containing protein [Candidatus Omnitrophota bacterium]